MEIAKTFLNRLRIAEQFLCFTAFMVMAGALIYDVLKREITGSGAFGAPQVGVIGMIVVSYIGIGLASAAGTHYRPRFADKVFPPRFDPLLKRIEEFGFAAFCAFLAFVATKVAIESYELKDVAPVLRNPIWPVQMTIALGFGSVAIRHVLYGIFLELKPKPSGEGAELASEQQAQEIIHGHDDYDREKAAARKGHTP
ncbi:MAG: TRAP transporter small permease subunit [Rhodospirillaceae bacterium]|nr:TRAP transporter small permease subunit [Rhodospirillaceae bacterium]